MDGLGSSFKPWKVFLGRGVCQGDLWPLRLCFSLICIILKPMLAGVVGGQHFCLTGKGLCGAARKERAPSLLFKVNIVSSIVTYAYCHNSYYSFFFFLHTSLYVSFFL